MPFLAYLFIYFYTFSNHITFPMLPRPHPPPPQTQKSRPRDSFLNLRAGNILYLLYRGLNIQFRPPGVQDDIQDKVEHNP